MYITMRKNAKTLYYFPFHKLRAYYREKVLLNLFKLILLKINIFIFIILGLMFIK